MKKVKLIILVKINCYIQSQIWWIWTKFKRILCEICWIISMLHDIYENVRFHMYTAQYYFSLLRFFSLKTQKQIAGKIHVYAWVFQHCGKKCYICGRKTKTETNGERERCMWESGRVKIKSFVAQISPSKIYLTHLSFSVCEWNLD